MPLLTTRTFTLVLVALVTAACQREESKPPAAASGNVATPPAATSNAATPSSADAPPEGVLRAYAWQCDDGQHFVMRNLYRERAVSIPMHDGSHRLDQAVSASGARYASPGESIVFWTKGATATLERRGLPPVHCQERRAGSLREDARLRGVVFRAHGNEPGWVLEIGPNGRLDWTTKYGEERHAYNDASLTATTGGSQRYRARRGDDTIEVTLRAEPCRDDADRAYGYSAIVAHASTTVRGCADRLDGPS